MNWRAAFSIEALWWAFVVGALSAFIFAVIFDGLLPDSIDVPLGGLIWVGMSSYYLLRVMGVFEAPPEVEDEDPGIRRL